MIDRFFLQGNLKSEFESILARKHARRFRSVRLRGDWAYEEVLDMFEYFVIMFL